MEYKCKYCGCCDFISQPNRYDIFKAIKGQIVLISSVSIEDKLVLYCRDCSNELEFIENDIEL